MNEGKEKLEAMRKMLKKKAHNNQAPQHNNTNEG